MRCSIEQDACVLYVRSKTCESMLTQCSHTHRLLKKATDAYGISRKHTPSHDFFLHADGINRKRTLSHDFISLDDKTRQKKSCYSKPMFLYTHPPACGKRQNLFDQREESLIHILCHLSAFPKGNPIFDQPECLVK